MEVNNRYISALHNIKVDSERRKDSPSNTVGENAGIAI